MASNQQAKRKAKQLFRLCLVQDSLDENRVRQVVQRVATAGRRDCPAILGYLYRLVRLDRAQHSANIESATPLAGDLQAAVERSLTRRYGSELVTSFAHLPSLIGGMRIQVGFDVYDDSVLAGLEALEKSF
jgi:F-type H+-transporting ATPase subunit delta